MQSRLPLKRRGLQIVYSAINCFSSISHLISLYPCDPLLHEISTLHVKEQGAVLNLDFSCGDDFGEGVVDQCLVGHLV